MKHIFAALALLLSITCSSASTNGLGSSSIDSAGFARLSEAEKAEVIKSVADRAATKDFMGNTSVPTAEKVERWVTVGASIGKGLAGAAKEVGVTVNEFAVTPVGQLTTVLIVWHMMGNQIVHIFGAIAIWILGYSILYFLFNRSNPTEVTRSTTEKNIFKNYAITGTDRSHVSGDVVAAYLAASAIVMGLGIIILVTGG
jgi:hypothetical protein